MNPEKLAAQIGGLRRALVSAKPRSRRRIELELQLRDLVVKQLRLEARQRRRAA